jgi:Carboxypeptidase regulatory-like domain/TonB-dependent Receptor Plug Domain/TonB dependent receptor
MRRSFARTPLAVLTLLVMLVQGTWVLAGTTGRLAGTVTEAAGNQPVSGAAVSVSSPSQSASTTTDASGRFTFLSLAPDTYTVTITKSGYVTVTQGGVTVQADGSVDVSYTAQRTLVQIGKTSARASTDVVRPGQVQDVYSVNAAAQTTVQALGGGGNLNSAYSALASVPGVIVPYGGSGTGQVLFIHGSSYSQVGYEYDGVPVNRAFDNYNGNSLSNLGQQELQVITSGSSASSSSATVAGFINQVIRSGTYPGYKNLQADFGAPTFYNAGRLELGGASPDRGFSYYIGGLLSRQAFRILDQTNGGGFGTAPFGNNGFDNQYTSLGNTPPAANGFPGVYPACRYNAATNSIDDPFTLPPGTPGARTPGTGGDPGCAVFNPPLNYFSTIPSRVRDNEVVANLHLGLPHRNKEGRDDVQLLYSGSALMTKYQNSFNDVGGPGSIASVIDANFNATGDPFPVWRDGFVFPANTPFLADASTVHKVPYFFPSSPVGRTFNAPIDPNLEDGTGNDAQIVKLQYQKNFGNAYLRAYGYTMYSDWLQNGPNYGGTGGFFVSIPSRDYELISHTRGGELQYATQLGAKNLFTATANYTTATVSRSNNSTFLSGNGTAATSFTDGTSCYNYLTGAPRSCFSGTTGGTIGTPIPAAYNPAALVGTPAAAAGASFRVTFNGFTGNTNSVSPVFTSFSMTDEFRPSDKLLLNGGLRYETYTYKRPGADDPAYRFWFNQAANSYCYDLRTGQPFLTPVAANPAALGLLPPVQIGFNNTCGVAAGPGQTSPTGRVDPATGDPVGNPNGQFGTVKYTTTGANQLVRSVLQPRLGLTYTVNPDTVLRFSGGLYTEPFNTATVQYLNQSAKSAASADFASFFGFGFNTPNHDFDPSKSVNVDASLEKHIRGTDVSYKFSPFYRYTKNQYQDFFIGAGFVSALPTGNETSYGAEFQLRKSDPSREGLSAQLSYTYTGGFMKFNKLGNGTTPVTQTNGIIDAYNALTRAGNRNGQTGAPCYVGGVPASASGTIGGVQVCNPGGSVPTLTAAGATYLDANGNQVVVNPYYNRPAAGYYSEVGPYPVYQTFVNDDFFLLNFSSNEQQIVEPHAFSGFVNYRKKRWDYAVAGTLTVGTSAANGISRYGTPYSVVGIDPRTCAANQTTVPTAPNPGMANYLSCDTSIARGGALFVPNPETGRFDGYGEFRQPWVLNLNASVAYEFSKSAKANVVFSNLFNRCFGGSRTPWSAAYAPGSNGVCTFQPNSLTYTGAGWYNGASPNDVAANGIAARNVQQHSYVPAVPLFLPFQMSLQLQFKL